jgi:hypothetical protein
MGAINALLVITAWAAVALLVAVGIATIAEEFAYGSRRRR